MFGPVMSTFVTLSGIFSRNSFTGALAMSNRTSARPLTSVSLTLMKFITSARTHDSSCSVATPSFQAAAGVGSGERNLKAKVACSLSPL